MLKLCSKACGDLKDCTIISGSMKGFSCLRSRVLRGFIAHWACGVHYFSLCVFFCWSRELSYILSILLFSCLTHSTIHVLFLVFASTHERSLSAYPWSIPDKLQSVDLCSGIDSPSPNNQPISLTSDWSASWLYLFAPLEMSVSSSLAGLGASHLAVAIDQWMTCAVMMVCYAGSPTVVWPSSSHTVTLCCSSQQQGCRNCARALFPCSLMEQLQRCAARIDCDF